jgi:hypothetical protein
MDTRTLSCPHIRVSPFTADAARALLSQVAPSLHTDGMDDQSAAILAMSMATAWADPDGDSARSEHLDRLAASVHMTARDGSR